MSWWQSLWDRIASWLGMTQPPQPVPPVPDPGKEEPVTPQTVKRRPWTLMVYMAGDNGKILDTKLGKIKLMDEMTSAGYKDLMKMGTVGTTDNVAATCLFDTQDATYRIEVRKGQGFADSIVQQVPEVNTGDPMALKQFIVDSIRAYPADHYALIIWNHGAGWLDTDVYAVTRSADPKRQRRDPIFRTTPPKMATNTGKTRGIAFDDTSKDFLDTAALNEALTGARQETGARLDLIGMDACLMAMVEGCQELRPHADYFVASEEVEPMYGWPYETILAALDSQPGITPADFSLAVIREYARHYGGKTRADDTITQSAVALARTDTTEALAKTLVDAILAKKDATLKRLLKEARSQTLAFEDSNYVDLGDFAVILADKTRYKPYPAVSQAAKALNDHLNARSKDSPVLQIGFGKRQERSTGLSVFLPTSLSTKLLETYRPLVFAQRTGWDQLLKWMYIDF